MWPYVICNLDTECLGKKLLESTNHDLNHLRKSFANNLSSLPTIENLNSKTEITTDLFNVIKKSENEAKVLGDTYLASDLITFYILSDENLQFTQDDKLDLSSLRKQIFKDREANSVTRPEFENHQNILSEYLIDITKQAEDGKLDPVIGRDTEIRRTIQVLQRRTKNNPVLIESSG